MKLFDAHNHLQDTRLGPVREEVIERMLEVGVSGCVVNGTHEADWDRVTQLARRYPWMRPAYGIHPWCASGLRPDWLERLEKLVVEGGSVGEIGLDFIRTQVCREEQEKVFRGQLDVARKCGVPASIHCVRAWGRMMDLVRERTLFPPYFLLHGYSGSVDLVSELTAAGAYFSINGSHWRRKRPVVADLVRAIPRERLLVETDAPYQVPLEAMCLERLKDPADHHPANVTAILMVLAKELETGMEELASVANENAQRLFS